MERIDVTNLKILSSEPRGYNVKYWVNDGKKKLVKYNSLMSPDADIMEKLASEILKNLDVETIDVQLGKNNNQLLLKVLKLNSGDCAVIDTFLTDEADIVVNLLYNKWVKINTNDIQKNISSCFYKMFNIFAGLANISSEDLEQMKRSYIRMVFTDCLIDNEDRRLKNIEAIYNERTFSYRLAPSFDNALAFNAYRPDAEEQNMEGMCYVGNQAFSTYEIITYIITHHYDYISDIIDKLNTLEDIDIVRFLKEYLECLPEDKVVYIFEYLRNIKEFVNTRASEMDKTHIK